jgi:hypothetical protein
LRLDFACNLPLPELAPFEGGPFTDVLPRSNPLGELFPRLRAAESHGKSLTEKIEKIGKKSASGEIFTGCKKRICKGKKKKK